VNLTKKRCEFNIFQSKITKLGCEKNIFAGSHTESTTGEDWWGYSKGSEGKRTKRNDSTQNKSQHPKSKLVPRPVPVAQLTRVT
jgi:hypothetical protein